MGGDAVRRGERHTWDAIAAAARKVAESKDFAEEYIAKMELRAAWAKLNGIPGVSGIPRSRSDL